MLLAIGVLFSPEIVGSEDPTVEKVRIPDPLIQDRFQEVSTRSRVRHGTHLEHLRSTADEAEQLLFEPVRYKHRPLALVYNHSAQDESALFIQVNDKIAVGIDTKIDGGEEQTILCAREA